VLKVIVNYQSIDTLRVYINPHQKKQYRSYQFTGENLMSQDDQNTPQEERIPIMQRVLDNPFLLLFIGVVVPTVFYVVWGIMELVSIPLAP
jgi:hypothetical protein